MADNDQPIKRWGVFTILPEEIPVMLNAIEALGGTVFAITPLVDAKLVITAYGDVALTEWVKATPIVDLPTKKD